MKEKLLFLIVFVLSQVLFSLSTKAQDYSDPTASDEVVVERLLDLTLPYRERRTRFGLLLSAQYEKFSPNSYMSIQQNKSYEQFSDNQAMDLMGLELAAKFNFSVGSVSAGAGYSSGSFHNDSRKIYNIEMTMTKLFTAFYLDTLMSEPWVVPYAQVGVHQIDWTEESYNPSNALIKQSVITSWVPHAKTGIMFQLDWIEKALFDSSTDSESLRNSGLENTFLDIYYQKYSETAAKTTNTVGSTEADFDSSNYGVALKLEF